MFFGFPAASIADSQYHDGSNSGPLLTLRKFIDLSKCVPMRCTCVPVSGTSGFVLVLYLLACSTVSGQAPTRSVPNSTEKVRSTPSAQAAKVGSAIKWLSSFDKARRKSVETGKPIFWYVPTIENSFMDRTTEIDRYMKAGMFSWPKIIKRLNHDFVPLMTVPEPKQARTYSLVPFKFVEPGFLVVDPAGKTMLRCDRLTTQHPMWLEKLLGTVSGVDLVEIKPVQKTSFSIEPAWQLFREGSYQECLDMMEAMSKQQFPDPTSSPEGVLLCGMCLHRQGKQDAAIETWRFAASKFGNDPLAWKAAAEAEGLGPFVRGFEVHRNLPAAAYDNIDYASITSSAPSLTYDTNELWRRGTHFLIGMQRSDGAFVDCDYDFGGTDSLPNVHVAITSICGMALIEAGARNVNVPQHPHGPQHDAVELARSFVLDDTNWNFNDSDELFWAHAYRVRFLAASIKLGWSGKAELQRAVRGLESMQSPSGSWYHEYPNPLVTSLALNALKEAESAGANIDRSIILKAVSSLKRNRGRGGFFYSDAATTSPHMRAQDLTDASAGRLPLCELALVQWGESDQQRLADAVQVSFDKQSHLLASWKYDDHTSRHAYGGFFFWFDINGRSQAIRNLANPVLKTDSRKKLKQLILTLPEIDGCFVDSHEIGRCYGTAMALLTLANTDESP